MNKVKSDRGDVPGWVLITLMTAGLVVLSLNGVIGLSRFRHSFGLWIPILVSGGLNSECFTE
jgi:hypothetical protein